MKFWCLRNANVIFDIRLFLRASVTVCKIHREFADSVSQKYENQVSSCSLISIAGRHTQDVTSTRAGGMYSQSVVFPRLAVIQSAKWKDRNGLWFGFRIIHYAAHNTPSPATAVLHTQSGRDWPHTRTMCTYKREQGHMWMCACVSNNKPMIKNNCVSIQQIVTNYNNTLDVSSNFRL